MAAHMRKFLTNWDRYEARACVGLTEGYGIDVSKGPEDGRRTQHDYTVKYETNPRISTVPGSASSRIAGTIKQPKAEHCDGRSGMLHPDDSHVRSRERLHRPNEDRQEATFSHSRI